LRLSGEQIYLQYYALKMEYRYGSYRVYNIEYYFVWVVNRKVMKFLSKRATLENQPITDTAANLYPFEV
ncbi:MAG: hypothetical protein KAG19_03185, partial [Methylococcales bacterium]|nr:hypothetical protein [Methylococcales bacterium]